MRPCRTIVARGVAIAISASAWALGPGIACSAPAPAVSITSLRQLPTPLPYPFDPRADAEAQVAAGAAKARASGKLLLIELGGDWCGDCRILAAVMRLPEVAAFVDKHYVVVPVDVGRIDRNLQIARRYGVKRVEGVPALLVVDGRGRLVDAGHVAALADARSMAPQALADWLARWTS